MSVSVFPDGIPMPGASLLPYTGPVECTVLCHHSGPLMTWALTGHTSCGVAVHAYSACSHSEWYTYWLVYLMSDMVYFLSKIHAKWYTLSDILPKRYSCWVIYMMCDILYEWCTIWVVEILSDMHD